MREIDEGPRERSRDNQLQSVADMVQVEGPIIMRRECS